MSSAPEHNQAILRSSPIDGPEAYADVIEISPRVAHDVAPSPDADVDPWEETVVLGRFVPHAGPSSTTAAQSITATTEYPATESAVVQGHRQHPLVDRRERYYSSPPPVRVQHRSWMLSSVVIAAGGVVAVLIAGNVGEIPLVGMIALIATVLCGAVLVAAQITEEVRRSRTLRQRSAVAPINHLTGHG